MLRIIKWKEFGSMLCGTFKNFRQNSQISERRFCHPSGTYQPDSREVKSSFEAVILQVEKKRMLFKLGEKLTQPLFKENKTQKCMKTLRKFQTRQASPNYLCIVITLSGVSRVYSTQCIICVHGESTDSHFSLEGNCHCHVYRDWLCLKIATR